MVPWLNLDVLCVVVSHSDWDTLFTLMLTSHQLNREASKCILRHPHLEASIEIDELGDEGVMSFIGFMRAEGGRYHYLRSLAMGEEELSPEVFEELSDIICRAINLKHLRLTSAETTLHNHVNIPFALASLRTIDHLYLSGGGTLTYQLLEAARWPLQYAEVVHDDENMGMNPIDLIRPIICPTLSELVLQDWKFYTPSTPFPVYPQLRKLVLIGRRCPIAHWANTFPHVKELVVRKGAQITISPQAHTSHTTVQARRRVVHDYNAQQNRLLGNSVWPFIDVFYVQDLSRAYNLALPCPVRNLVFNDMRSWSTFMLKDVMERARPRELKIRKADPEHLTERLRAFLECAEGSLRGLRRLSIYLIQPRNHTKWNTDIFEILGDVMLGLRCLHALEFCVFYIETSLIMPGSLQVGSTGGRDREAGAASKGDEGAANQDDSTSDATIAHNILDTDLPSREPQISSFYAASFDGLSTLRYLVIMGGSVMYGMRRGGRLARKPLLDHGSRWFPDI